MATNLDRVLELAGTIQPTRTKLGTPPFPGMSQIPLPPVPHNKIAAQMFTAHRVDDMHRQLAHCRERWNAIKSCPPGERQYHLIHVNNHLSNAIQQAQGLAQSLQRNYPQEWGELKSLSQTMAFAVSLSPDAKVSTFAHLLQTTLNHLSHAKRHALVMTGAKPSGKLWDFNCEHSMTHTDGAQEHVAKLADHLMDNYPAEAGWLAKLQKPDDTSGGKIVRMTAETPEASTVPAPIGKPGGGLWRHKGWQLPPYIQHVRNALMRHGHGETEATHMAVGIVKNWAKGHDGHGHRTHADVRAAASANVAKWEELRGKAHAVTAAKHAARAGKRDHDVAASDTMPLLAQLLELSIEAPAGLLDELLLAQPATSSKRTTFYQSSMLDKATVPGGRAIGRIVHAPSQTTAASPVLPPGASLPSPAELHQLGADITATGVKSLQLDGAAKHAHAAAVKMAAKQPLDALRMLRSCASGIMSAHREYNASQIPVANVFTASLNPAEAASARAEMFAGLDKRNAFRRLGVQCAAHIDRIRRHWFHGMYGTTAAMRFSGGLESILELADGQPSGDTGMIYLLAPRDFMPDDTTIDKPGHITVIYLGHITPEQFDDACQRCQAAAKALPPLHGTMGGLGFFESSHKSDGKRVAYYPVYAEGIHRLRVLLEDLLAPEAEKDFVPHATVAYLGPDDPPPSPATSGRICFSQLFCARGDKIRAFAFTGRHPAHDQGKFYRDRRSTGEAALSRVLEAAGQ